MSTVLEVCFDTDLPCNDWNKLDTCPLKEMSEPDGQCLCWKCGNSLYINEAQVDLKDEDVFGRLSKRQ